MISVMGAIIVMTVLIMENKVTLLISEAKWKKTKEGISKLSFSALGVAQRASSMLVTRGHPRLTIAVVCL